MTTTDVTEHVSVGMGQMDGEHMPIYRCLCGTEFAQWDAVLSIYPEDPWDCPNCGAKLVFARIIKVLQIEP